MIMLLKALFVPTRRWLESIEIHDPQLAHLICKVIPAQCPFAREIKILNWTIAKIPPLCKLNPFYEQLMLLRFKSLGYLANECAEDISAYCS